MGGADDPRARRRPPAARRPARCSPPRTRSPRCSGWRRAWRRELRREGDRRHRVDRQDLDQGPAAGAARARTGARSPRARTSTPRSACRSRSSPRRPGTEVLVLEMAMRGAGQIAELAAIAEPDVGVIVSIGPVHLELLGTIEAIAAAKAELIAGAGARGHRDRPRGRAAARAAPARRRDDRHVRRGRRRPARARTLRGPREDRRRRASRSTLEVPFTQAHLRRNLLAAVAAARAVGVTRSGRVDARALARVAGSGARCPTR